MIHIPLHHISNIFQFQNTTALSADGSWNQIEIIYIVIDIKPSTGAGKGL
jgi:hypothetical protein